MDEWGNEITGKSDTEFEYVTRKKGKKKKGRKMSESAKLRVEIRRDLFDQNANPKEFDRTIDYKLENSDSTIDETPVEEDSFKRRLTRDAVLICAPKLSRLPSLEQSGTIPQGDLDRILINTKALPKESTTYELERFTKNCLIIFNQEEIDGFEPRLGSAKDAHVLKETFGQFGFEVEEHKDYTKRQIMDVLDTFKTRDFTEYGCVAVAVLTHGTFNGLLRAKDQTYGETEIINYFRVHDKPTLITKPKILIIQACRGTRCLPGVYVATQSSQVRKDLDEDVEPYTLPVTSDMLIVHSSYVGEASIRDEIQGSWFIQTLCRKVNELSVSQDMQAILTEVKREVAADRYWEEFNRVTFETDQYKQMPTVTSTLIRKLYLRRFGEEGPPVSMLDRSESVPSRAPVLDIATTPMLVQLGPCSCFLEHFEYIKRCLTLYLEEDPGDMIARTFLEISETFEDEHKFNTAKERMARAMSDHLLAHAVNHSFHKYLYFYKQ